MANKMKSEKGKKARPLISFCAFHFIDDGFTDSIYLLLPFIAAELSLNFSQVGLLKGEEHLGTLGRTFGDVGANGNNKTHNT
jgi:hypothetical protein